MALDPLRFRLLAASITLNIFDIVFILGNEVITVQ